MAETVKYNLYMGGKALAKEIKMKELTTIFKKHFSDINRLDREKNRT